MANGYPEFKCVTFDAVWPVPAGEDLTRDEAGEILRLATERLCREAEEAVRDGATILVLSDQKSDCTDVADSVIAGCRRGASSPDSPGAADVGQPCLCQW